MNPSKFESIRPFVDAEIPEAMQRIARHELFAPLSAFVFPGRDVGEVREQVRQIRTIRQFQHEIMAKVNERIIESTTGGLIVEGLDNLSPDTAYTFVSNHRDIMLDSSFLQYLLHINGFETSEITFGANLMTHPLVVDIGKANKMFRVERGGNRRDFYKYTLLNSEYIRHAVTEKHQSVWIAQRNGRTKDGIDRTEPGLVRMFAASGSDNMAESLAELNITPVAISYEWETCDLQKVLEIYISQSGSYQKTEDEDLNSILSGILSWKGKVYINICKPIDGGVLGAFASLPKGEQIRRVAEVVDYRIKEAYHLTPNNYIAHDLRSGSSEFSSFYTPGEKERFVGRLSAVANFNPDMYNPKKMSDIFLGIYANPVQR